MKFCRECGTPCEDETVFCRVCGTRFHTYVSEIDAGFTTAYFVTDNDTMEAVLDRPVILIANEVISDIRTILPLLEEVVKNKRQVLIIVDKVEGEVNVTLIVNKLKGVLACAAIETHELGEKRKDILEDIGILTGGYVFSSDSELELQNATLSICGQAKEVRIAEDKTIITGGYGDESKIIDRIYQLREEISAAQSEADKEIIRNRLNNMFCFIE